MPDQGKTAAFGAGIVLAVDQNHDLASDAVNTVAVQQGLLFAGSSASQEV